MKRTKDETKDERRKRKAEHAEEGDLRALAEDEDADDWFRGDMGRR